MNTVHLEPIQTTKAMPVSKERVRLEGRLFGWLTDETRGRLDADIPFGCHNALSDLLALGFVTASPYRLTQRGRALVRMQ